MENNIIEIELLEFSGLVSALTALRLPFGRDVRSVCDATEYVRFGSNYCSYSAEAEIHSKDITLLQTLINRGDEHAKVVRGINVYLSINAPRFWWQEMDTYRIGTERLSSESTMHIQGQGLSESELVEMKSNLTEGTMQKRIQMFSYQTLRRIYIQRQNHRLPHWREFCEFIESLPFAKELILVGIKDE